MRAEVLCLCATLFLVALPARGAPATAKDKEAARALAQAGYELYVEGKYEEAIARLDAAEALYHAPPHHELAGRALEKLGRLLEARKRYQLVTAEPPAKQSPKAFHETFAAAQRALASLDARIPTLAVKLIHAEDHGPLEVTVDGAKADKVAASTPQELNPGQHTIRILEGGNPLATQTVTLAEGARETVLFTLQPKPRPFFDHPSTIFGAVAVAGGTAGLVLGAVTGTMSLDTVAGLGQRCPDKLCPESEAPALDQAKTLASVSTAGFVVGGALVATGAVLLIVRPGAKKPQAGARVTPEIGVGYLGVRGVF